MIPFGVASEGKLNRSYLKVNLKNTTWISERTILTRRTKEATKKVKSITNQFHLNLVLFPWLTIDSSQLKNKKLLKDRSLHRRYSKNSFRKAEKSCSRTCLYLKITICWVLLSLTIQLWQLTSLPNKLSSLRNINVWKRINSNLMTGCPVKQKAALEIRNLNTSTEEEWRLSGTNTTVSTIMMTTLHPKQFKGTNSTSSTQNCLINKKLHNITCKPLKVQISASSSSKQDHLIRTLASKFKEGSGTSHKNQDSKAYSTKEFFSFTSTLRNPSLEFDLFDLCKFRKISIIVEGLCYFCF